MPYQFNPLTGNFDLVNPQLTGSEIKTLYEGEDNTNAFTDAEKTTLSTALQPPAIANFETSTQLNVRDAANRLWTNLTSIPSWIVNATTFGQSLITAASNTAAKTLLALTKSDVGLGDVDNTSDANKPVSTATQSALNLKAPLNNPTFTGTNLILPNNTRINGVEMFYQSTKPTARGDGSPLVIGDMWYNPITGVEGFWNGTYWLSPQYTITTGRYGLYSTSQAGTSAILRAESFLPQSDILLASGKITQSGSGANLVDYWTGQLGYHQHLQSVSTLLGPVINLSLATPNVSGSTTEFVINTALTGGSNARMLGIQLIKVGSPGAIFVVAQYNYHYIL